MIVERRREGDDALAAEQILHAGLLGPAVGFVGFELELRHSFYWVAGRQDFGVLGVELVSCRGAAREGPVALFVEASGDGFDGAGQEIVVVGDGDGEAGFDCTDWRVKRFGRKSSWQFALFFNQAQGQAHPSLG